MKITHYITSVAISLFATSATPAFAQTAQEYADLYADLALFETPMATSLKKGTKRGDIKKMKHEQLQQTALSLLEKSYSTEYRLADYKAYLNPQTLGRQLVIGSGYSNFENMTGIYLPKGKHIVLVDGIAPGKEIKITLPNWNRRAPEGTDPTKDPSGWGIQRKQTALQNGANLIEVTDYDALAYIHYYSDAPQQENPITVHFPSAQVNGYFDVTRGDTDADWNKIIDNAVYPVVDARGRHIQIAYPAEACKQYAYSRGKELVAAYDTMVALQHHFLGLDKYNRVPENRILARVNYNYYMFRDGDGVAYMGAKPGYAMPLVVKPEVVTKGDPCWGFNHEVGHVHQLRPYLNWGGLGEVSNNIVTLYVTTALGNKSRLMEGNNYVKSRDSLIVAQRGLLRDNDVFNRLVPFWQLQLYFSGAGNNPSFYPDLHEEFRKQALEDAGSRRQGPGAGQRGGANPAEYQLNFVKKCCIVGKTDLTEFFEQYGFFSVDDFTLNDYGNYHYQMTQEMVDACKAEIKALNLPRPKVDLSMLTD